MDIHLQNFNVIEVYANNIEKESIQYGVRMIGAQSQWNETKGENIKVAIVDTGIDFNHPDLKDRVKGGINFTSDDPNDYMDRNGHGTHCAGVLAASMNDFGIVGVAPEVDLYAVKILSDEGKGSVSWMIQAVDWCIENNINIMSMSLGTNKENTDMYDAIVRANNKGIIMICAAGNDSKGEFVNTVDYPAKYNETISVAAIDINNDVGDFSSRGEEVDVSSAGVDVYSTYLSGGYAKLSGTSMATPHIAGAVALIQSNNMKKNGKYLSVEEMKSFLLSKTKDIGSSGIDNATGYGFFTFD